MKCPECGSEIVFSYVTPAKSFKIEIDEMKNEIIFRDDAWKGPEYDDPYLEFYCSNDKEHDIEVQEIIDWTEGITEDFYLYVFPNF